MPTNKSQKKPEFLLGRLNRPAPFTIIHALEFRLQRMQEKLFAINRQTSNLPPAKTTKDVRRHIRSPLISEIDRHDSGRQMQGMC